MSIHRFNVNFNGSSQIVLAINIFLSSSNWVRFSFLKFNPLTSLGKISRIVVEAPWCLARRSDLWKFGYCLVALCIKWSCVKEHFCLAICSNLKAIVCRCRCNEVPFDHCCHIVGKKNTCLKSCQQLLGLRSTGSCCIFSRSINRCCLSGCCVIKRLAQTKLAGSAKAFNFIRNILGLIGVTSYRVFTIVLHLTWNTIKFYFNIRSIQTCALDHYLLSSTHISKVSWNLSNGGQISNGPAIITCIIAVDQLGRIHGQALFKENRGLSITNWLVSGHSTSKKIKSLAAESHVFSDKSI